MHNSFFDCWSQTGTLAGLPSKRIANVILNLEKIDKRKCKLMLVSIHYSYGSLGWAVSGANYPVWKTFSPLQKKRWQWDDIIKKVLVKWRTQWKYYICFFSFIYVRTFTSDLCEEMRRQLNLQNHLFFFFFFSGIISWQVMWVKS